MKLISSDRSLSMLFLALTLFIKVGIRECEAIFSVSATDFY